MRKPLDITPEEMERAIGLIRAGKAPVRLGSAEQILEAVKIGVISKPEARKLLGLPKRKQPDALRKAKRTWPPLTGA